VVGGCASDTSAEFAFVSVGISNVNNSSEIEIFPNPATDEIVIKTSNAHPLMISIYDINGREISEQKYTTRLNVGAFTNGIYFIEIKGTDIVSRKMFVKM
jgi:hypothetical protein